MTIFTTKASFDGIEFPVLSYSIVGGLRSHVHEYPHTPGGAVEKLGRKLYTFRFTAIFDQRVSGYGNNLFPGDLSDLRDRWEDQVTSDLFVQTLGAPISAYCKSWQENADPGIQSGVKLELEFEEDQSQAFLINSLVQVSASTLKSAGDTFSEAFDPYLNGGALTQYGTITPPTDGIVRAETVGEAFTRLRASDVNLLGQIRSGFNKVISLSELPDRNVDQILRTANDMIAKCERARDIVLLKNPLSWQTLRALRDVEARFVDVRDTTVERNRIITLTTKVDTSVIALSRTIYGDSSFAAQIMQLNGFADPFKIPKGTLVRYYDPQTRTNNAA